jgi:hypothetical protein
MRLILDECVDEGLRRYFTGHECQTCRYAGFAGLANGELLSAAESAGFSVLITVDQNMPTQQNLAGRSISLMVLRARTTNLDDLVDLVPEALTALARIGPGEVVRIGAS